MKSKEAEQAEKLYKPKKMAKKSFWAWKPSWGTFLTRHEDDRPFEVPPPVVERQTR